MISTALIRRQVPAAIVVVSLAVALGAGLALWRHSSTVPAAPFNGTGLTFGPGQRPAPPFTLHDLSGSGSVSVASLRGQVVLLTFLDSHCKNLCPVVGHELAAVERQSAAVGAHPVLLAVSVNPAGDTHASVATAARRYGWPAGWHWAGGTHRALAAVWKRYGIQVIPTTNDIAHGEAVYVIDVHGDERAIYEPPFGPASVTADVRALAKESTGGG